MSKSGPGTSKSGEITCKRTIGPTIDTFDIVVRYDSELREQVESGSDDPLGWIDDVESLVNSIIRNPDRVMTTSDGKAVFVYKVESDKKPIPVYVGSNGFTQTAYPQDLP